MTFEEKLFSRKSTGGGVIDSASQAKSFGEDCRAIFSSVQGRRVLAALCGAAHPLKHSSGMSEHEHGQSEVVATLWRFGSSDRIIEI